MAHPAPAVPVVSKNKRCTLERAEKFISSMYFTDCNLYGRLYPVKSPVSITHRKVNGRVSFQEATAEWMSKSKKVKYPPAKEVKTGSAYGPTWATHWFQLELKIPDIWKGKEVHLLWNSGSEAMVWHDNGEPLQGLNNDDRTSFVLTYNHTPNSNTYQRLYIEMACNTVFGGGHGLIGPPAPDRMFTLSQAKIAVFDRNVYNLMMDIETLVDMVKHIPETDQRSYQALYTVNKMINVLSLDDHGTYATAQEICKQFLHQRSGQSVHTIHACGHAHIDTAWLWPYAETKRKCARTWANVLRLMEQYPEFTFAFSQAQQFDWVKTNYPSLFGQIKQMVKQGRFIPVGGCWVEMDGNLPSGESFVRQLLYGQKFFMDEFGIQCKEFWLPDTFGYSAQLPQILTGAGIQRFMSQKLSWNLINKFPHNTFWWQGIDGTKCLAHFPPTNTYSAQVKVEELLKTAKNNKDKGRVSHSLMLFGHGDGGGGPTMDMLERIRRLQDTDGLPKVKSSTPNDFFRAIEDESDQLCTWQGELYLELHQGTFTTQADIKKLNRLLENQLRLVEFLSILHPASKDVALQQRIANQWKRVLLHQFHDVLPGSCIRDVVVDATTDMRALMEELQSNIKNMLCTILGSKKSGKTRESDTPTSSQPCGDKLTTTKVMCNNLSWERCEVIDLGVKAPQASDSEKEAPERGNDVKRLKRDPMETESQKSPSQNLALVRIPSMSIAAVKGIQATESYKPAKIEESGDGFKLSNGHIQAHFDRRGLLIKMVHTVKGTPDVIHQNGPHGNQFVVFDDVPLFWDAWDVMEYHMETRKPIIDCTSASIESCHPLQVTLKIKLTISPKSWLDQEITLRAESKYLEFHTKVHWMESHKFLKVEFPVNVHSPHATYDIQFGHVSRPTHQNTSWDWARYEVVGHKWMDLSQHDWGVAILNNCKYGHSVIGNIMRLSLLRSPKSPDDKADMGDHTFSYAIMPHNGTFQQAGVIQASYEFNNPLTLVDVPSVLDNFSDQAMQLFQVTPSSVIIETVKKAEDQQDALVVRLYEAYGGEAQARFVTRLPLSRVVRCNLLEQDSSPSDNFQMTTNDIILFTLKPFQILSMMLFIDTKKPLNPVAVLF